MTLSSGDWRRGGLLNGAQRIRHAARRFDALKDGDEVLSHFLIHDDLGFLLRLDCCFELRPESLAERHVGIGPRRIDPVRVVLRQPRALRGKDKDDVSQVGFVPYSRFVGDMSLSAERSGARDRSSPASPLARVSVEIGAVLIRW